MLRPSDCDALCGQTFRDYGARSRHERNCQACRELIEYAIKHLELPPGVTKQTALLLRTKLLLPFLTSREIEVLRRRVGIQNYPKETLEQIGRQFHVTRERIREVEGKAMRKVRFWTLGVKAGRKARQRADDMEAGEPDETGLAKGVLAA